MAKQPRVNPLKAGLDEIIEKARQDALDFEITIMERHLRNGLDNGVTAETLAAVFEIPIQEIHYFEQHGHLEE